MTDTLTLKHLVNGQAIAGAPSLTQANPADPNDFTVELPEADAALV